VKVNKKIELFRNEPGFDKLFRRFRDKYRSVGRIGGVVKLGDFSREELEALAGFLAISPDILKEKAALSLKVFDEHLAKTNLEGLTLKSLLELYFGEPLISKAEEKAAQDEAEKEFYQQLTSEFPVLEWWFKRITNKEPDTRFIQMLYQQDKYGLEELIRQLAKAVEMLPESGHYERLPLFSQRVTGHPHSFDRNQPLGKLFLHFLAWYQDRQPEKGITSLGRAMQTEQMNELLLNYGILRDDLWSFVTCRGFRAFIHQAEHPVWQAAARFGTVMNIPVRELVMLDKIKPLEGETVWVVENSGVCSAIMDVVPEKPIVCTHGQFRVASWIFFDRLVESGCTIYYSGDMDPEGLWMAQRLKNRYPGHIKIWRMDPESYSTALSEENITERIPQLKNIDDPILKETAKVMAQKRLAAYQEGLLELLINDISGCQG
jgi:uncharacterized protein (TIGR02679 family)